MGYPGFSQLATRKVTENGFTLARGTAGIYMPTPGGPWSNISGGSIQVGGQGAAVQYVSGDAVEWT